MSKGRRGRHEEHEEHENHERWLVSYADMVTLLMVFFIVLFAMSTLDVNKYRAIAESFSEAIGGGPTEVIPISADAEPQIPQPTPGPSASPDSATDPESQKSPEDIAEELKAEIAAAGLSNDVKVTTDERGVVLLLTNSLLFTPGRADILPAGRRTLERLSPLIAQRDKPLVIEGHTDNVPISNSQYLSNWELSTGRSTNVLRFLLLQGIDPKRLTASGYADTHPLATNSTVEGREENRRVEIILVVRPGDTRDAVAYRAGSQ